MIQKKVSFFFCLLLFVVSGSAQITDKDKASPTTTVSAKELEKVSPFSRGINNFIIQQNFGYRTLKPENSDNNTRRIDLNLDYNRFVVDSFAIGAALHLSSI